MNVGKETILRHFGVMPLLKTEPVSTADTQASDAKTEEKDTADAGTGDEAEETTTKPRVTGVTLK